LLCVGLLVVGQGTAGTALTKFQGFRHLAEWQPAPQRATLHLLHAVSPLLSYLISLQYQFLQEEHTFLLQIITTTMVIIFIHFIQPAATV
jgi:hypothetical protein